MTHTHTHYIYVYIYMFICIYIYVYWHIVLGGCPNPNLRIGASRFKGNLFRIWLVRPWFPVDVPFKPSNHLIAQESQKVRNYVVVGHFWMNWHHFYIKRLEDVPSKCYIGSVLSKCRKWAPEHFRAPTGDANTNWTALETRANTIGKFVQLYSIYDEVSN